LRKIRFIVWEFLSRKKVASETYLVSVIRQSNLFDVELYKSLYPEVMNMDIDPVVHYIRYGVDHGAYTSIAFSTAYYREYYPDVAGSNLNPLIHFIKYGRLINRLGIGEHEKQFLSQGRIILNSGLWDQEFYCSKYPEACNHQLHPLQHYFQHGAYQGKDPSSEFSSSFYLAENPDVEKLKMNPLLHYVRFGKAEGRYPTAERKEYPAKVGARAKIRFFIDRLGFSKTEDNHLFYFVLEGWYHAGEHAEMPELILKTGHEEFAIRLRKKRADVIKVLGEQPFSTGFSEVFLLSPPYTGQFRIKDRKSGRLFKEEKLENLTETKYAKDEYVSWQKSNDPGAMDLEQMRIESRKFKRTPLVSILMPVYNPELPWLKNAVASVEKQVYNNWELCIADDVSTIPNVIEYLKNINKNSKISVKFRKRNGHISKSTNDAAKMAKGEYLVFLDHDDYLLPHALFEAVKAMQQKTVPDIIYADQDHLSISNERFDPVFKPDYSYFMLLSSNYFNHPTIVKRELFNKIGGLRKGFEGAQDFDMLLRMLNENPNIYHIPKILYSWRLTPGSVSTSIGEDSHIIGYSKNAIEHHLGERGFPQFAYRPELSQRLNLSLFQLDLEQSEKTVDIIIPVKNNHQITDKCISSIIRKTVYQNFRLLIIDNASDDPETIAYLEQLKDDRIQVFGISEPFENFSHSYLMNEAVKRSDAEFVLFLNNDTEVIQPRWLNRLMAYAIFDEVGAVGARLYYPDDTIQHAGIVVDFESEPIVSYAFSGLPRNVISYCDYDEVSAEKSAVSAACMMTKRSLFNEINGFDQESFPNSYNDVDFCLRLINQGYKVVYCPGAELYHFESYTRSSMNDTEYLQLLFQKYAPYRDPFYNINLVPDGSYRMKTKEPDEKNKTRKITNS